MRYRVYLKNGQELKLAMPDFCTAIEKGEKTISFYEGKDTTGLLLATVTIDSLSHVVLTNDND